MKQLPLTEKETEQLIDVIKYAFLMGYVDHAYDTKIESKKMKK